ncbi:MAG: UvrD-helicase domain-containing protein [Magnetococcales bacterium]|nr:UvrD-helicase domain-containing protein [Magnetococcales bacterium]
MEGPADRVQRQRALDPHGSFIVQAPAGSGKTGLLIQRFLLLLARVEQPEQVVAITFTRKAADEMRRRIIAALSKAQSWSADSIAPVDDYSRQLLILAQSVLLQDQRLGWQLLHNPERLRTMTIDALCAAITHQTPVLSGFGTQPDHLDRDDADRCYRQASQDTLRHLACSPPWDTALQQLFDHLDHRWDQAESLLAEMLQRRDQWLPLVVRGRELDRECRLHLQQALQRLIQDRLATALALVPAWLQQQLPPLAEYAVDHLVSNPKASIQLIQQLQYYRQQQPVGAWRWPTASTDQLLCWHALINLLLTSAGLWRRQVNVNMGFPASSKKEKAALTQLLQQLDDDRYQSLRLALHGLQRSLPETSDYNDEQWQILQTLLQLLPLAVGELQRLFVRLNKVDFTAITLQSLQALGSPEQPTDLALRMDGTIQHLLVDEFQDTSRSHYQLLQQLTCEWDGQDGRTLFLVGDPMQSIYRFREANVGLFLQVKRYGLGAIQPEFLRLTVNFRSRANLIEWNNQLLQQVMPVQEDIGTGAIPFTAATPAQSPPPPECVSNDPPVEIHTLCSFDHEAARVVEIIHASDPEQTIAVLARNRNGLYPVITALQQADIAFQAVDVASLSQSQLVTDLLTLTQALLLPGDRVSWLALLRTPWCALSLADIATIIAPDPTAPVWQLLQQSEQRAQLSQDGQQRSHRLVAILTAAFKNRRRSDGWNAIAPLRRWIEGVWRALGGPLLVTDPIEQDNAALFFDLLQQSECGGELADPTVLVKRIQSVRAVTSRDAVSARIQLMTIHKAKGLEFDVVVVTALALGQRSHDRPLLLWQERQRPDGHTDLLLAPIQRSDQADPDPVYRMLQDWNQQADQHEQTRLLYVALTRARHKLHLLASVTQQQNGTLKTPRTGSLLRLLWSVIHHDCEQQLLAEQQQPLAAVPDTTTVTTQRHHVLRADWQPQPVTPLSLPLPALQPEADPVTQVQSESTILFQWAGELIRCIGVVVHRSFCFIDQQRRLGRPVSIATYLPVIQHHLMRLGVPSCHLNEAVQQVQQALQQTLSDPRGQWLFDASHQHPASEWAIGGSVDGKTYRAVIDRTFIDAEGYRWIVDFKTSRHSGSDLELFLDHEQERYRPQLQLYARLMRQMAGEHQRPIRLGLYFPLFPAWREVV